ncbi:AAA family ATPase [Hippea alviniae]|uniref:bifunctional aminoglycoside phosphotransferase/ATP-binding protein n=1 Tax=Hippea alviniae TaxID=1279027 RepID=UPI0003B550C5|nr:bifunctional aminoglycoside phosphotransferase/ATP-binding protein [Hippea alviniae]
MTEEQIDKLAKRYGFEIIQTHISWVLLGKSKVYKIKKPVDFGFLNYTTIDKRLEFCKKEVELNRRLAEEIYEGVSTINEENGELFIDGDGKVVDYAVRMKRMPQDRMMDVLIESDLITDEEIEALAKKIAEFHKKAETNDYISSFGSIKTNKFNTDENFQQTEDAVGEFITRFQYESLKKFTDEFYKKNKELFDKRIKETKIRDCHGDMYSRNICIVDKQRIFIYDCIEFNERFRYSDVASDVAFLLMDLENLGRWDLSDKFLKFYLEYSKDSSLNDILDFYKIYRAYVRGKIAFFQNNKEEANRYFDLAFGYLPDEYKPKVLVFSGLSGSGKSTVVLELSKRYGFVVLSSDVIRKRLAGLSLDDKEMVSFGEGIYSMEMTRKTYSKMFEDAYQLVRIGKSVILDATFLRSSSRKAVEKLFKRLGIKPVIVFFDIDDKTAKKHFEKREKEESVSDGRFEIYLKQKEILEKPENAITVNANWSVEKIVSFIGGCYK